MKNNTWMFKRNINPKIIEWVILDWATGDLYTESAPSWQSFRYLVDFMEAFELSPRFEVLGKL